MQEVDANGMAYPTQQYAALGNGFILQQLDDQQQQVQQQVLQQQQQQQPEEQQQQQADEHEQNGAANGKDGGGVGGAGNNKAMRPKPPRPNTVELCPRCSSNDTKFCYYNNYNVNQPRWYCKTCQRYWTAGGTLRNIPPGSGRRKSNKSKGSSKELDKQALAEQLAKQSVASAMLANPATLAAAVPFLNPMLAAESTMLAYNAAAAQQQALLGSAALNAALGSMPGGLPGQWPPGFNGMLNGGTAAQVDGGMVAGASSGGMGAGGSVLGGPDGDVTSSQQEQPRAKRARTEEPQYKTETDGFGISGTPHSQPSGPLGSADDPSGSAAVTAGGQSGLAGAGTLPATPSGGAGAALGGSLMHGVLPGSWGNLGGAELLGAASNAVMNGGALDQMTVLNGATGAVKSPVAAAAVATTAVHNVAAAAALQQQQVLQYQQMMQAQLLQQQLAAQHQLGVAAAGLQAANPYGLALPHLAYPFNYAANAGLANLATFNPAAAAAPNSGMHQWNALAAQQPFGAAGTVGWVSDPNGQLVQDARGNGA